MRRGNVSPAIDVAVPSGEHAVGLPRRRNRNGGCMLGRILLGLAVAILVAFGGFYAWQWRGELPPATASAHAFDPGIVAKGAQLAALGNCVTCHTRPGGKPYAGGLPIETPFGTLY